MKVKDKQTSNDKNYKSQNTNIKQYAKHKRLNLPVDGKEILRSFGI
jgi:hypothetical protein